MFANLATLARGNQKKRWVVACGMVRLKGSKKRQFKNRPLSMTPKVSNVSPNDYHCVACGKGCSKKYDTSLMCSLEHSTCFSCVSAGVQPHELCGNYCNGFKYKCAKCDTWLCINKTQELAVLCGSHSLSRDRLKEALMCRDGFDKQCTLVHRGPTSSSGDSERSWESEEFVNTTETAHYNEETGRVVEKLPRVCTIDWSIGREERAMRLSLLRTSLLGHTH